MKRVRVRRFGEADDGDPVLLEQPPHVTTLWHVHPAAGAWKQPPSDMDHRVADSGVINVVVGARDKTVYFYDNSQKVLHMKLKKFMEDQ